MSRADRYLKACRKESVDCTPVWIMRQAGRYLEEYRAVRAKHSFIEVCKTPELVVEITLQPIRRFELDAAIIFADILLPLEKMGIDFEFTKDDGPQINNTVRTRGDVEKMRAINPMEEMSYLMDAIRMVKRELNGQGPADRFLRRTVHPGKLYHRRGRLPELCLYQVHDVPGARHVAPAHGKTDRHGHRLPERPDKAGVQAVQVFDSWVGCLSPADYREFVLPHQKRLMASLDKSVPHIHFAFGASHLLTMVKEAGGDVIGLDWRMDIDEAWKTLNHEPGVQGNLDPVALYGSRDYIKRRVQDILDRVGNRNGHIFNLGHGILPTAPTGQREIHD